MNLKKGLQTILLVVFITICNQNIFSQINQTADYINSVFYFKRLSLLRNSYETKNQDSSKLGTGGSSLIMDFNFYARDPDNDMIMPMMVGYGTNNKKFLKTFGIYFLAYSSNLFNFAPPDTTPGFSKWAHWGGTDDEAKINMRYVGLTGGISINLKYITLQGDATMSKNTAIFYTKAFIPIIKTQIGCSFSKFKEMDYDTFDENGDSIRTRRIQLSDKFGPDGFEFRTYSLRYLTVGMRYLHWFKSKYIPNISMSLSQAFPKKNFPFDLELFFESRGKTPLESVNVTSLKDYDTRFIIYYGNINKVFLLYTAFSYKSKEDGFSRTLTESGGVYNGQNGFGFDLGFCLRNPGQTATNGFLDKNFIKYSIYYNYSEYFERYPGNVWGMKFRILL